MYNLCRFQATFKLNIDKLAYRYNRIVELLFKLIGKLFMHYLRHGLTRKQSYFRLSSMFTLKLILMGAN